MPDYEVLICGLGPVGQLMALLLGDLGVRTLAIDRAPDIYPLPRAAVIDDEVLRIFQSVGADAAVLEHAQVQPRASIMTARGVPVDVLAATAGSLGHPPLVSIHQPTMERALLDALAQRSTVDVQRGTELDGFDQRGTHVDALLRPAGGGRATPVTARYLVACDGAGSAVRASLGIPFTGSTAPERWIVVDAQVDRALRKVPHPYFVGEASRPSVTLPMSPGRHRWEWMVHPGEDPTPLLEPHALDAAIAPWLDGERADIERAVVYTFHTRTARRWRAGRVLLAGDAAHLMPPFAGQGFSSGARDAANLAWKLHSVLAGAPQQLLDTYETERRAHVRAMQRTANLMGSLVQATDTATVQARDAILHRFNGTVVQRWVTSHVKPLPSYHAGAFATRPARRSGRRTVGTLFPQTGRLDDELGRGWSAVAIDELAAAKLTAAGLVVHDPGPEAAWLTRRGLTWALLRPDRFVFAAGGGHDVGPGLAAWRALQPARPSVRAMS
ncbi:MAG: bifunctional 3-(3-hydroxy-phenyl)propionate/3-hydroxycinnamic acid hydroxylase [Solirubrobacteraceae bacterium]|nr:bifunctional 3-(3-hydroxy-phenyl)propionate/3-hydroxycinnamic acid hydroxylase [Solirubrobacteraceae bacterium]